MMNEEYEIILSPLQYKLLHLLSKNGPMTRDQLCKTFGFKKYTIHYLQAYPHRIQPKSRYHREIEQYYKRTTIYDNLAKLEKRKLVEKFSRSNGKRGRPLIFWKCK